MTYLFNFYGVIPKSKNANLKGYKQHYIEPNSRILMMVVLAQENPMLSLTLSSAVQVNLVKLSFVVFQLPMNHYITIYNRRYPM